MKVRTRAPEEVAAELCHIMASYMPLGNKDEIRSDRDSTDTAASRDGAVALTNPN